MAARTSKDGTVMRRPDDGMCSICGEIITESVYHPACGTHFCGSCIDGHLGIGLSIGSSRSFGMNNNCPWCKKRMSPRTGHVQDEAYDQFVIEKYGSKIYNERKMEKVGEMAEDARRMEVAKKELNDKKTMKRRPDNEAIYCLFKMILKDDECLLIPPAFTTQDVRIRADMPVTELMDYMKQAYKRKHGMDVNFIHLYYPDDMKKNEISGGDNSWIYDFYREGNTQLYYRVDLP